MEVIEMIDELPSELVAILDVKALKESKWVKSLKTRMRVFNTQIFANVLEGHCKDNAEMNYAYMAKNFLKLRNMAILDESITDNEYYAFVKQYNNNFEELVVKRIKQLKEEENI